MSRISIPELSLVALIGASGAGKSSFARRFFKPTEVLSSDYCRGLVSDDENDQAATADAFEVLYFIAAKRLAAAKLTVVDATNVRPEDRKRLVELARRHHCLPVALVLDMPERICHARNQARPERQFGEHVVRNQVQQLRRSLRGLEREGFRHVHVLRSPEEIDALEIERQPLWNNKKDVSGPFDIIGDVHGCLAELRELLLALGYELAEGPEGTTATHPEGRRAVFVGDLVDRGPDSPGVIDLVMNMVAAKSAFCVAGNHDIKLSRALFGKKVTVSHGLAESLAQLEARDAEYRERAAKFMDALVSHYVFDGGKLVVAHAGLKEEMHGRGSGAVRAFCMYGETTGETDEFGLPIRYNWAADYRGRAMVVYGHTPVPEAEWLNNTICLDTGCVFGGKLTALRYPERELVAIAAHRQYYEPIRPLVPVSTDTRSAQQQHDDLLSLDDVVGKRLVETRLGRKITVHEANAVAALEVMSRFAIDPRWLVYLPPTMSPPETHADGEWLEHPDEAFAYYRKEGVTQLVCEEKHMGSRAVVVICRDAAAARDRFGVEGDAIGVVYTRTGRAFFSNAQLQAELLVRLQAAITAAGWWERFDSSWFCVDAELMPWSAKAHDLVRQQYASVGAAATASLGALDAILSQASNAAIDLAELRTQAQARGQMAADYIEAYRRYCWPVQQIDDLKLAPFHLLASEHGVHVDQDHVWHMRTLAELEAADPALFLATAYREVDLANAESVTAATEWWLALTARGGEGMVVKPHAFIASGRRGYAQPAVKCRGREYLRIIYGPEYSALQNLERLRQRGVAAKRGLAAREFALGIEGLERFVRREPPAACARMRLRRAGHGKRADRPAAVGFLGAPTSSSAPLSDVRVRPGLSADEDVGAPRTALLTRPRARTPRSPARWRRG